MRIAVQNIDFAKGAAAHRALIEHLCSLADLDVLALVECKREDIAALAPPGWHVWQDRENQAKAGCALLSKTVPTNVHLTLGSNSRLGHRVAKMLGRYILCADVAGFHVRDAHYPPKRYRFLWPKFTKSLARTITSPTRTVVVGDMNQPYAKVPKRLRLRRFHLAAHGQGIDGIFTGQHVGVTRVVVDFTGKHHGWTDHPAVICDLS